MHVLHLPTLLKPKITCTLTTHDATPEVRSEPGLYRELTTRRSLLMVEELQWEAILESVSVQ